MAFEQTQGDWLSNLIGHDLTTNSWHVECPEAANDDEAFDFEEAMEWLTLKGLKMR